MSLDLAPEVETAVRQYAEREGVSPDELLLRAFPPISPTLPTTPANAGDAATSVTALLRRWQQEYGLPARPDGQGHTPAQELFARWEAEDAQRSPEEAKADQHLWEDHQREHQKVVH